MLDTVMEIPIPTEIPGTALKQDTAQVQKRQGWATFGLLSWTGLQMLSGWLGNWELSSLELPGCSWPADQHKDCGWLVHRIQPTLPLLYFMHRNCEVSPAWNQGSCPISF